MINLDSKKYSSKIIGSEEEIAKISQALKKQGKKIGLCTGCFDLLHPGHINYLVSAKKMCDVLIVAVARDERYIKNKGGKGRPVFSHDIRAFMISQLKPVDYVFLEDGVPEIVLSIKPDLVIKGKDCITEKNPGLLEQEKLLNSLGGKMVYTQTEKLSTTEIIKHIKENVEV